MLWTSKLELVDNETSIMSVSVGPPINKIDELMIGKTLLEVAQIFGFSVDDFIVLNTGDEILKPTTRIESDVVLRLCHNVSVSGVLNQSFVIEHGTKLGEIEELSGFFSDSHVISNSSNMKQLVGKETRVENDIDVVIMKSSKQVIIISFDEKTDVDADGIKDALDDIVSKPGDGRFWIEVTPRNDGSFVISVIQTNEETIDVGDVLIDCMNHKSLLFSLFFATPFLYFILTDNWLWG